MLSTNLNFEYLSPTGSIGILITILGIIFTIMTIFVFINIRNDEDSSDDIKRKKAAREEQLKKIERLYPQKK